jgi:hypothetical protein
MIGADSRLTAAAGGMPAFTAGGTVLLGGSAWTARATLVGAIGDRGWGYQGEYAVRTMGHVGFAARGTAERPIDLGTVGEQTAFLAVNRKSGRATFTVDGGGLVTRSELGVGGIAGATLTLGDFEISAEAGRFQMVTTGGGITSPTQPGGLTDTLAPAPEPAASPSQVPGALSHAALAGRWRRGVLELSARVLSRSAIAGSGSIGWMAGLALGPFNGVRLRAGVGDVPSGSALYMPNRKQVLFGLEIARIPRLRNGSVPEPVAAKAAGLMVAYHDGIAVLEVTDLRARQVEISADFTDWQPLAMVPASGVWRHEQVLAPGTYRINVRFDGGAWQVPVGLPTVADEFGGEVGLLVVGM